HLLFKTRGRFMHLEPISLREAHREEASIAAKACRVVCCQSSPFQSGGGFLFRGYSSPREDPGSQGPGRAPGTGAIDPRHEKEPPPCHATFLDRQGYSGHVPAGSHPCGFGISSLVLCPPEEVAHSTRKGDGQGEEVPGAATSPA